MNLFKIIKNEYIYVLFSDGHCTINKQFDYTGKGEESENVD
jgi:hypothetical protein